jgi:hypothetical protein
VALTITDVLMSSDQTPHTAKRGQRGGIVRDVWRVSWLSDRLLTRNEAITAMTLAEQVDRNGLWDYRSSANIDAWAAELGLTGPQAIAMLGGVPEQENPDAT